VSGQPDLPASARSLPLRAHVSRTALPALLLVVGLLLLPSAHGPSVGVAPAPLSRTVSAAAPPLAAMPSAPLAIISFSEFLSTMVLGQSNYFNVSATGGAPPYTYWYHGLPTGCLSQNVSSLGCYPISAANFVVTVVVNDTTGASANASVSLHVGTGYGGPPVITTFYASPSLAPVGMEVLIYANATSSSSTPSFELKYAYLDLPPGCAGFNQTVLQCIPSASGSFHLYLLVTDGFGAFATARTWLNVTGGVNASATPVLTKPMIEILGGLAVAFVIVVAAIFLIPGRRKRRPAPSVEAWKQ
jgi:hypothetical protein